MKIDSTEIEVISKEFASANILKASVGTNGYCGGDSGHGSRTYFAIEDLVSTDIRYKINDENSFQDLEKLEIILGGDTELETIIESLEFIVTTLKSKAIR